jgi:hypothetical protein
MPAPEPTPTATTRRPSHSKPIKTTVTRQLGRKERIAGILERLDSELRIGPLRLLEEILDIKNDCYSRYRQSYYSSDPRNTAVYDLLNAIAADPDGRRRLLFWITGTEKGRSIVSDAVHDEMESVSASINIHDKGDIDPGYLSDWSLECHREQAPLVYSVLLSAAQSRLQEIRNKYKKPDKVLLLPIL